MRQETIQIGDWRICVKEYGNITMLREAMRGTPQILFTGRYLKAESGKYTFKIDNSCCEAWTHPDNFMHRTYLLSWVTDHLGDVVAGFDLLERGKRLIKRAFSGRPTMSA